ncbi:anhydro-N-acetylmuramic acid kinase AnmK [Virgibacillus flavescens]|uniref:anhydro-N-acetylmuramic acid kinase AnmK n=1 Tax=Virgibacillus flavescens TaxID=1611422 RepID=UPI003D3371A0
MQKTIGIGLMSGTSLDGIDAVLVELEGSGDNIDAKIIDTLTKQYSKEVREEILKLCSPDTADLQKICSMNVFLAREFSLAVFELLEKANVSNNEVDFISSHGQTIYHHPFQGDDKVDVPGTLQIGDLSVLSEETGIAVVGDFRTADMAVNGQGAPLVSYVDYLLFSSNLKSRAIQNIGGIGNVTYIPKKSSKDSIRSFDTGPGNMVIDEIISRITSGNESYDKNGKMAYLGTINQELLNNLMEHEYFSLAPPKTTGRELFGKTYVDNILNKFSHIKPEDLVTTISEWTVVSIVHSYREFLEKADYQIDEVIVGGGGSYNSYLLERLKHHLPNTEVHTHEQFHISSDFKEALAFAILGYQCIHANYNQIPSATGSDRPVIMGKIAYTQPEAFNRMDSSRRGLK